MCCALCNEAIEAPDCFSRGMAGRKLGAIGFSLEPASVNQSRDCWSWREARAVSAQLSMFDIWPITPIGSSAIRGTLASCKQHLHSDN